MKKLILLLVIVPALLLSDNEFGLLPVSVTPDSLSVVSNYVDSVRTNTPTLSMFNDTNSILQTQISDNKWYQPEKAIGSNVSQIFREDGLSFPYWFSVNTNANGGAYFYIVPHIDQGRIINYRYKYAIATNDTTTSVVAYFVGVLTTNLVNAQYRTNAITQGTLLATGTGGVYKVYSVTGTVSLSSSIAPYYGMLQLLRQTTCIRTQYMGDVQIQIE